MTPESPASVPNDVAEKNGRRHRRLRRGARAEARVEPEERETPAEEPEQRTNKYVRLTEDSVPDRPLTAIEAAEQEVARCKEVLLHALRSTQSAAATAARVREEAAEATAEVQRITD